MCVCCKVDSIMYAHCSVGPPKHGFCIHQSVNIAILGYIVLSLSNYCCIGWIRGAKVWLYQSKSLSQRLLISYILDTIMKIPILYQEKNLASNKSFGIFKDETPLLCFCNKSYVDVVACRWYYYCKQGLSLSFKSYFFTSSTFFPFSLSIVT